LIEASTIFVLGAGANCSYGYPSGEKLKVQAATAVRRSARATDDNSFLLMASLGAAKSEEVQPDRCEALAEALQNAGQASIDAFLNANQHQLGFHAIGKGAIAQVLLEYERKDIESNNDDWLDYIFKVMIDGIDSPEALVDKNRVGFVTFNYDRLLESWLFRRIKYSFGLEDAVALEVLRQIPIHHVYGMLGSFPTKYEPHSWIAASKGIRTIFDAEHDKATLDAAEALLARAHVICLLGFGFHRENIDLISLVDHARACKGVVASSRYQILDQEWVRLMRPFKGIDIRHAHFTHKSLEAIRHLPLF
jgi:hypothetical protein